MPDCWNQQKAELFFLDEITEMSTSLQGKFLRFMQKGEVRRIGSHDVRNGNCEGGGGGQ